MFRVQGLGGCPLGTPNVRDHTILAAQKKVRNLDPFSRSAVCSPLDRIQGIWGSYYDMPKASKPGDLFRIYPKP